MVAPSGAVKTTAVVSIHEEKNTEVEIPRIDPEDKAKLWMSKIEIRHNSMMAKIQGMVQEKIFELIAKNNDFFAGIENITLENDDDDDQKQQKPETEEDILLAKKAQLLQSLLNAIMELPKEEIFTFLTSSSLPSGLNRSSTKSLGRQPENSAGDTSGIDGSENINQSKEMQQQHDENHDSYNWILDSDESWEDLPAVVRINAMELGYNETLWDEDAQDLPIFRTLWKKLTPNQRTAAVFLGNYDELSWNDDVRVLLLGGKPPSLASLPEDTSPEEEPVADIAQQTNDDRDVVAKNPQDDTRYDNEEEDAMLDEFLSNFGVSTDDKDSDGDNKQMSEKESRVKTSSVIPKNDNEEEDMMDEFLSNFAVSAEEDDIDKNSGNKHSPEKARSALTSTVVPQNDNQEETMMDEFLSNFVESAKDDKDSDGDNKQISEKESSVPASSVVSKNYDEEDSMMDEFLSNFVESKEEESGANSSNEKNPEILNDENDDAAMMDEFLSNFVVPNEEEGDTNSDNDHVPRESHVPDYEIMREDSREDDKEQPLVSKPKESIMERGFQGETSPLLPSNREKNEPPLPDPPTTWDTLSSYLYWLPVIIGLPVVYIVANGSQALKS